MSLAGVFLALSLGLDVFAAGLALGLAGLPGARWARVGLLFAVLGGLMTVLGLLGGRWLGDTLGGQATLLAGALLIVIGARALVEAWRVRRSESEGDEAEAEAALGGAPAGESLRPAAVLMTGLVVTLDKLAVGLSLGAAGLRTGPLAGLHRRAELPVHDRRAGPGAAPGGPDRGPRRPGRGDGVCGHRYPAGGRRAAR